jgi:hypothetical protein
MKNAAKKTAKVAKKTAQAAASAALSTMAEELRPSGKQREKHDDRNE